MKTGFSRSEGAFFMRKRGLMVARNRTNSMNAFLAVCGLSAVVAVLVLIPTSAAAPLARAAEFFTDPTGDSGGTPDIADVQVGNDLVAGSLVFWVDTPNRTTFGATDLVSIFVDSDLNAATGALDWGGAEYSIDVYAETPTLWQWNGTSWVQIPAPALRASYSEGDKSLRVEVHPNVLGNTRAFNFYAFSATGTQSGDYAPDVRLWTYSLVTGTLKLTIEEFLATPKVPRAGKAFAAAVLVGRDDTNEILEQGAVTCVLKLAGKALGPTARAFSEGVGGCRWKLPKTARGKQLKLTIAVKFGGATASRTFSAKVR
jgi:hypothetical protein